MRNAIHALKYNRMHAAACVLGPMLADAIGRLAREAPAEMLVVPVPIYRKKRARRGFNQARLLAEHAIRALRKTHPEWHLTFVPGALMRVRATMSQAGLTPRQRRQNLRGVFRVANPTAIAGRHVLVIDDIFTTGATARAAAVTLTQAGAAGVWIATLARAERLNHNSRNSSARIQPARMRRGTPGDAPAGNSQVADMCSLPNQPSF
jgi:ComF family protein